MGFGAVFPSHVADRQKNDAMGGVMKFKGEPLTLATDGLEASTTEEVAESGVAFLGRSDARERVCESAEEINDPGVSTRGVDDASYLRNA